MDQLTIFVIFHKKIYDHMYKDLDPDELSVLRFVAANPATLENIDEQKTPNGTEIIKEWELEKYDQTLQKNNWWIGGVVHHVVSNDVCKTKYMGFAQHDFRFTKGSVRNLASMMNEGRGVCLRAMDFKRLVETSTFGMYEFELYTYALTQLPKLRIPTFPIYHSCFMETYKYRLLIDGLMKVDKYLYQFHNKPGDPIYRFAITSERTLALAIGGVLDELLEIKDIIHEEKI